MSVLIYEYCLAGEDRVRLVQTPEANRKAIMHALVTTHQRPIESLVLKRASRLAEPGIPLLGEPPAAEDVSYSWDKVVSKIRGREITKP